MSRIVTIPIRDIKPNPYRNLKTYPWIERKIDHLMQSIESIGMWESIIARPTDAGRYEAAFGHHRLEAAKRLKMKEIPIIVRKLTDEQMVQFMGRENGEDYNTDALVLLNTWAGAYQYLTSPLARGGSQPTPVEMANLLGWTRMHSRDQILQPDNVASFCSSAYALIKAGHLDIFDLRDLNVASARALTERLHARVEHINRMTHKPEKERQESIGHFARATKQVADKVRAGTIASKDVRGAIDVTAMENAQFVKGKPIPDFEIFGRDLANMLRRMLKEDAAGEKLDMIVKVLPRLTDETDRGTVRMLRFELDELGTRAGSYSNKLIREKVVGLPQLEKK